MFIQHQPCCIRSLQIIIGDRPNKIGPVFVWQHFFFFLNFWRTWVLFVGPLIPLFWTSGDVSSGFQSQSGFCLIRAYVLRYTFPEIHLWCNTCWPLGSQHGSWDVSSTYLRGIGGTRNWELSCRHSQCEIRQTLYRLSYPGSACLTTLCLRSILSNTYNSLCAPVSCISYSLAHWSSVSNFDLHEAWYSCFTSWSVEKLHHMPTCCYPIYQP